MADELAGLRPAGAPVAPENDVVQTQLQHAQQVLAGYPLLPVGLFVIIAELLFEHPVYAAGLLLFPQLGQVLRTLADPVPAVLTGGVGPALDRALDRVALRPFKKSFIFSRRQRRHTGPM